MNEWIHIVIDGFFSGVSFNKGQAILVDLNSLLVSFICAFRVDIFNTWQRPQLDDASLFFFQDKRLHCHRTGAPPHVTGPVLTKVKSISTLV